MGVFYYSRLVIGSQNMLGIPPPIRTPTRGDLTIIFWVIVLIFIGFGLVCFAYALNAPPEAASKLFWGGCKSIGVGVGICLARKYFCGY